MNMLRSPLTAMKLVLEKSTPDSKAPSFYTVSPQHPFLMRHNIVAGEGDFMIAEAGSGFGVKGVS